MSALITAAPTLALRRAADELLWTVNGKGERNVGGKDSGGSCSSRLLKMSVVMVMVMLIVIVVVRFCSWHCFLRPVDSEIRSTREGSQSSCLLLARRDSGHTCEQTFQVMVVVPAEPADNF